jgi:LuxR family maltose regulon positive regulatory protein
MEKMMAKMTPQIRHKQLFCHPDPTPICTVGSPAWFAWLETVTSFRYFSAQRHNFFRGYGPLFAPISLRKEQRRHGWLWYAYRRTHGVLHKRYVGKSQAVTLEKLEEVAALLNDIW